MSIRYPTVSWASGGSIYEMNTRQYTTEGTFNAMAKHLPRLKDMGIQILWLMPITPISLKNRLGSLGSYYACSSYTDINPEYGTLDDFKSLVKYAQQLGLKVIIDWVANHTGWDHHWATEHPDWYIKDSEGNFTDPNGWADVIDLDYTNKNMRKALIKAMQFWVKETGIDGFRCDMAHLVPLDFWLEARPACDKLKPLFWLAECEVMEYHAVFDVTYAWEWMHVTEKMIKEVHSLEFKKAVLMKYSQYPAGSQKLFFTSNHDENSWNGTEYEKYGAAALPLAVFTCTWRDMPLVYSGQELPNLKRLKFFEKDTINWDKPPVLHGFYKTLLNLKKSNPALHLDGSLIPLNTGADDKVLVYLRVKGGHKVLVLLNLSNTHKLQLTVSNPKLAGHYRNIFSGLSFTFENIITFELQAWEYLVYKLVVPGED